MLAHAARCEVGPHVAKTHDVSSDGRGLPMQVTQSPPKGLIMRRSLRNPRPSRAARPFDRVGLVAALALSGIFATQGFALDPGATITAGPQTPADAKAALSSSKTVVIAFVVPGAADDDEVAASIARLRSNASASRNVRFLVYKVTSKKPTFGDLPKVLQILGTPTVAVITPDDRLQNMWTGLVDDVLIGQSISTARESAGRGADSSPAPKVTTKPTNRLGQRTSKKVAAAAANAKGLALAKKVNAAYASAPGVEIKSTGKGSSMSTIALTSGLPSQLSKVSRSGNTGIELVDTGRASFVRPLGASCWQKSGRSAANSTRRGVIDLTKSTFRLQGRSGKLLRLRGSQTSGTATIVSHYLIDPSSYQLRSATAGGGSAAGTVLKYRTLATAPTILAPSPLC